MLFVRDLWYVCACVYESSEASAYSFGLATNPNPTRARRYPLNINPKPDPKPDSISGPAGSGRVADLYLCSSAMPHWTIHHSIVISSYNIACILRTVHYTENQSTATIKACIIRYCTAIIHSWIVSYDMAEFHIWNSLKQKPLAPPNIITTINAAMSWCLHFLGILKELFKPKINTLPSFTHNHVTHINTKEDILNNVQTTLDSSDFYCMGTFLESHTGLEQHKS